MAACAWCGESIAEDGGRGRPRDYCSRSCRAKAYRARKATAGRAATTHAARAPGGGRPQARDASGRDEGGGHLSGPHLSAERIVTAAIALADAEGLENLHMRRLAAYLGAGTMSLYRHVGGRDELIHLMVEAAMGEEPQPDPAPVGWRAGLEYTARRDWALYRRHPWILRHAMVGSRMRWTRNAVLDGERALSAFDGLAVPLEEQLRLLMIVVAFTQGIALIHVNDVELTQKTGVTAQQWWDREGRHLNPELMADLPRLSSAFREPRPFQLELERRFEEGLNGVLDGVGALLTAGDTAAAARG
ncbi:TetR/AcrR family transcriptional regulator [Yinghuangia sp. YIM S09857]|uniref:TetR/AcrR family transcriptional regulator n=1 Tax=Yinghuangia sp. YIM S09857 TaxID=3436929 RepID=UPI003F52A5B0